MLHETMHKLGRAGQLQESHYLFLKLGFQFLLLPLEVLVAFLHGKGGIRQFSRRFVVGFPGQGGHLVVVGGRTVYQASESRQLHGAAIDKLAADRTTSFLVGKVRHQRLRSRSER